MTKFLPRVKLYPHNQRDQDILDWLDKIQPGFKGHAIKEAIWSSINRQPQPAAIPNADQSRKVESRRISTTSTMRAEVTFDTHELLADIRQIVEVGVTSALGHLSTKENQPMIQENEKEIEAMLDDLDMSFMLDDDDEEEEL